jgi:DNA polymerase III sliding clamp (beta) subunit (PCNA family)
LIGFNHKYLQEAFKAIESETVNISLVDSVNPCRVENADEEESNFKYIIYPMRVKV